MSCNFDLFGKKHVFLPVIHVAGPEQVVYNTLLARDNGADGVVLINHNVPCAAMLEAYTWIKRDFPDFWIGMNFLGLGRVEAAKVVSRSILEKLQGWQIDDIGIDEDDPNLSTEAYKFMLARQSVGFSGLCFGGAAFKYQKRVLDVGRVARVAKQFCEVVTTSGDETGTPPSIRKIRAMKIAIGERWPLAIASGIAADNVAEYKPFASFFLVASSLIRDDQGEGDPDQFDPAKIRRLAAAIAAE